MVSELRLNFSSFAVQTNSLQQLHTSTKCGPPASGVIVCVQMGTGLVISIDGVVFSKPSRVIHYPFSHPNINNSRYAATRETLEAAGVCEPLIPVLVDSQRLLRHHTTPQTAAFSLPATSPHVCVFRRESASLSSLSSAAVAVCSAV